ncbi:MAG TPA: hypothetical protein VN253_20090, partial [Kofleriaceae bacterium]|nr:hypothetical protein [Kofleriaceae bacterium]
MPDETDDLLRRAMKTLDDQVPPGYFEDLPNRTLLRLEDDRSMQTDDPAASTGSPVAATSSTDASVRAASAAAEPAAQLPAASPRREEDSGLHDIRSLASSQRMRLSKRTSQQSIIRDEELIS